MTGSACTAISPGRSAAHVQLRAGTAIVRVPESLPAAVLAPASCATATAWAAVGGTVVLVGRVFPAEPVPFDAESVVRRLVTIAGVHNYTGVELADAVAFLAGRGRAFPFADAVGEVRQLADIDQALAAASAPGAPLRIGLSPDR